jgi:arylsulfatase
VGAGPNTPAHSRGFITPEAGTIAQILKANGYRTSATGKWHLTPTREQADSVKNKSNWPTGKGFDNFYGWLTGWTDQYNPRGLGQEMMEGDHPAKEDNPGGNHVSEAIVDHAINYLKQGFASSPQQPQFLYLAFGAGHSPIQAPKSYIDKYKGVYAKGWDKLREERFARQKQLGIIPKDAVLTERFSDDPAWETLSNDQKIVFAQFMTVYAGFIEHMDAQIGRLISYLKESGKYNNTLIFLMSDNGAAPEAGLTGGFSKPYGDTMTLAQMLEHLDDLGTEKSQPLYQRPWAMAGGSPFKRYKLWPYGGGVRDPLIITWPQVIRDKGAIRTQFVDVTDITPTVLDVLKIKAPATLGDVKQMDMHGASILPSLTSAKAPAAHTTQLYVMRGNRAIYDKGWKAIAIHKAGTDFEQDVWELYNVEKDFSESVDLAAKYPDKVKELKALWWSQAEKYGALPLVERSLPAGNGGAGARGGRGGE